jgi:hypothetical protein
MLFQIESVPFPAIQPTFSTWPRTASGHASGMDTDTRLRLTMALRAAYEVDPDAMMMIVREYQTGLIDVEQMEAAWPDLIEHNQGLQAERH